MILIFYFGIYLFNIVLNLCYILMDDLDYVVLFFISIEFGVVVWNF